MTGPSSSPQSHTTTAAIVRTLEILRRSTVISARALCRLLRLSSLNTTCDADMLRCLQRYTICSAHRPHQHPPTSRESVPVRMLEALITNHPRGDKLWMHILRYFSQAHPRADVPPSMAALLHSPVFLAAYSMTYCKSAYIVPKKVAIADSSALIWPCSDICTIIWMHLDNEATLRAAVVQLLEDVKAIRPSHAVVYGAISSGLHCISSDWTFIHTLLSPFLPSWYATSPSAPGSIALDCLFYLPDNRIASKLMQWPPMSYASEDEEPESLAFESVYGSRTGGAFGRILTDVLQRIAGPLPDWGAQAAFTRLCPRTAIAASTVLRGVVINSTGAQYRLVAVSPEDGTQRLQAPSSIPQARLLCARFDALLDGGSEVEVHVGRHLWMRDTIQKGTIRCISFAGGYGGERRGTNYSVRGDKEE